MAAEPGDQAAVLRDGDEHGRRDGAALGVHPAGERLDAARAAGGEVDDRLERDADARPRRARGAGRPRAAAARTRWRAWPRRRARPGRGRAALARYIAASASRSSAPDSARPCFAIAMPVEPETYTFSSPSRNGSAQAPASRRAASSASHGPDRPSHSTTNSSPPSRATTSPGRAAARRRGAIWHSSSSPVSWPKRVVDDLELVEVDHQHGERGVLAGGARERRLEPLDEQVAVRQARERVVQGAVAERGDRRLALVAGERDDERGQRAHGDEALRVQQRLESGVDAERPVPGRGEGDAGARGEQRHRGGAREAEAHRGPHEDREDEVGRVGAAGQGEAEGRGERDHHPGRLEHPARGRPARPARGEHEQRRQDHEHAGDVAREPGPPGLAGGVGGEAGAGHEREHPGGGAEHRGGGREHDGEQQHVAHPPQRALGPGPAQDRGGRAGGHQRVGDALHAEHPERHAAVEGAGEDVARHHADPAAPPEQHEQGDVDPGREPDRRRVLDRRELQAEERAREVHGSHEQHDAGRARDRVGGDSHATFIGSAGVSLEHVTSPKASARNDWLARQAKLPS